jgi:hypothetical protein
MVTIVLVHINMFSPSHIYEQLHRIDKTWHWLKKKIVETQINNNLFHIITRIQFPIQQVAICIIHWAQDLTFNCLTFDPIGVSKHDFTCVTLYHIPFKKHVYLLSSLST